MTGTEGSSTPAQQAADGFSPPKRCLFGCGTFGKAYDSGLARLVRVTVAVSIEQ